MQFSNHHLSIIVISKCSNSLEIKSIFFSVHQMNVTERQCKTLTQTSKDHTSMP